jgi:hypothetical protein
VEAECLKLLAKVPTPVVDGLLAFYNTPVPAGEGLFMPYYETKEDVVLVGLFDLLLEHMTRGAYRKGPTSIRGNERAYLSPRQGAIKAHSAALHHPRPYENRIAPARMESHLDFIGTFLRTTQRYDVYRYLVSMMVANHHPEAWALLVEVARQEQNQHKVGILLSVLALVQHDPAIIELTRELQQKLEA